MPRSSLSDLTVGQWQQFRQELAAAGLDGDMVVDMLMRPHLLSEMVQGLVWRKDPTNWVREGLVGLEQDTRVSEMPPGSVGWVSTEIFTRHHDGYGAYAWRELVARPNQEHALQSRKAEWVSGSTAIIRSRSGGFWALNTHLAGTRMAASEKSDATDVYVQVVNIMTLAEVLGGLPGRAQPYAITTKDALEYKVVVQHEDGASEAETQNCWLLYALEDGEWRMARRDNPADARAFELASETNWLQEAAGEYSLRVS